MSEKADNEKKQNGSCYTGVKPKQRKGELNMATERLTASLTDFSWPGWRRLRQRQVNVACKTSGLCRKHSKLCFPQIHRLRMSWCVRRFNKTPSSPDSVWIATKWNLQGNYVVRARSDLTNYVARTDRRTNQRAERQTLSWLLPDRWRQWPTLLSLSVLGFF